MVQGSYFENALREVWDTGILDILLPFILIFTLVFAILQRTKILGKTSAGAPQKNFNSVVSLVIALSAVIPHVLWGTGDVRNPYLTNGTLDVVQVINNALPQVSLVIVAVLMLLVIIGVWGNNIDIAGTSLGGLVTIVSILGVLLIFALSSGWVGDLPRWLYWLDDPQTQSVIVVILVFGLIIKFITGGDDGKEKGPGEKNFLESFGELLKPTDKSRMGKK